MPGVDYLEIPGGAPFSTQDGKVEVVEVFGYTCPHCASFEPHLVAWERTLPDDVALVGFDALGAERTTPRLTTVLQPVVEMVSAATSTLLDMVNGVPAPTEPQIFVPRLVEGESA